MRTMSKLLFISTLIFLSLSWNYNNPFLQEQITNSAQQQQWLDQSIDHFNYHSNATFKQRYFILNDFYKAGGPVYVYICGQSVCRGVANTSWTAELAKRTNGMIFALEHRFYGESMPFGKESMEQKNLRFLNSEQGLSDLAYFIQFITKNKKHGVDSKNKWITVGGSYAGAMSAWFRSKYPHLTVGAIGSSGVVLAVEDFSAFDDQIYASAAKNGVQCATTLQEVNKYVESKISGGDREAFQAEFKAEKLTARQFLFYWADAVVFRFQYSKGVEFCQSLKGKSTAEAYEVVKAIALGVSPVDYGAYYLGNATFAMQDGRGARAWIYQSCTQFSYFQTPGKNPMRSTQLTLDFYKEWCASIFGEGSWPFVDRVNNQFGGLSIKATNLFLSNGDQDPWRWAGLQESKGNIISRVYHCPNCGHCVDLHALADNDPAQLKAVRDEEYKYVQRWLNLAGPTIETQ